MYYYRRVSTELLSLANASTAKTFGELCGKFNTNVTSDVSDQRTRVDVVFVHYLLNFIKGEREAYGQKDLSRGVRRIVEGS